MLRREPISENITNLEISKLCKLLAAVIEFANERPCGVVDDFVGAHVTALGESLSTYFAWIGSFTGMASFVGLWNS